MNRGPRIHIVCFGNLLAGDDGVAIHALAGLRALEWTNFPAEIEIFDAGIAGFSALTFFEDCEAALIVDALAWAGEEGRVQRYGLADVSAPRAAFSAHSLDLTHLVHVLPILFEGRRVPEIRIVGVEINAPDGTFSLKLSPAIQASIAPLLDAVREEVRNFAEANVSSESLGGPASAAWAPERANETKII